MLMSHGINEILKMIKIGVVSAKLSRQFPHPFYRIQLGTVGREEFQGQRTGMFLEERMQKDSMMVLCIVQDDHHLFSSRAIMK